MNCETRVSIRQKKQALIDGASSFKFRKQKKRRGFQMGWQKTNDKTEQSNNSGAVRRHRAQSVAIPGREVERIILQRQYSSTELNTTVERNELETTQQTSLTCTIVGQILRIVGDNLDKVKKDNYEITNYGRV